MKKNIRKIYCDRCGKEMGDSPDLFIPDPEPTKKSNVTGPFGFMLRMTYLKISYDDLGNPIESSYYPESDDLCKDCITYAIKCMGEIFRKKR